MSLLLCIAYIVVIGAVAVCMTVLLLKGKKEFYNIMYMICQAMVIFWCSSQILILLSETREELIFSYTLGNIGICFVGCFWYYFALLYTKGKITWLNKYLPITVSVAHFICVITNEKHHMFYSELTTENIGHGVFFYTNVVSTYILVILGAVLLYKNILEKREGKSDRILIIASVLVPLAMNLVYMTGIIKVSFDITALGFGISGILVLLATIKYRFLEVNITAFDVVLEGVSDGVGIFGKNGKCTYANEAFYELLGMKRGVERKLSMATITDTILQLQVYEKDGQVYSDGKGRYLQIQIYKLDESGFKEFKSNPLSFCSNSSNYEENQMKQISMDSIEEKRIIVFMVKDISKYYELLNRTRELMVTNERLVLEKERNRIAQQVHDTAGHTLTMIQSYMKLAEVSAGKQEYAEVTEFLHEARALSGKGIKELRESINQLRKQAEFELVTQGIMQLADYVKEIPVEVTVQGEDSDKYSHLSKILYDCTREAITNTLKYADASKMEIILRFGEESVELIIWDDGKGCEKISENNGIYGIRERIGEAGGTVKLLSGKDEGFLIRIGVPV